MSKNKLTVHMVVKNEDQWIWHAIMSVLPLADKILIVDTGSTDHTVSIIKSIQSPKISFSEQSIHTANELTKIRQTQIEQTETDWFWLVDGDEVYPNSLLHEIKIATASPMYEGIAVRRYDLLGDIYHRQKESVGTYRLFGQEGHLVSRLFNKRKIPGIHVSGDYPLEAYYDGNDQKTASHDHQNWYITQNALYHAMYLKRSSQGAQLSWMPNRSKYKIETGFPVPGPLPEVFSLPRPSHVPDPLARRSLAYELAAQALTPVKNLKRTLVKTL